MNDRWSLGELYDSFESEKFLGDKESLRKVLDELLSYAKKNFTLPISDSIEESAQKLTNYLTMYMEALRLSDLLGAYTQLTVAVDVMNDTANKNYDLLEELYNEFTEPSVLMQKYVSNINNLDDIIQASDMLKAHEFYLKELKSLSKYLLSEQEEVIISKMENTGSSAWERLRDMLTATLAVEIEINGELRNEPLTVIRNYAYSSDAALRKNAYEAELASYTKIDKSVAACLNGIKGEVLTISKLRGYSSPLEMTLLNARMDQETLDALIGAIEKHLPNIQKYFMHKAKLLGHKNGLPFYDLFAPVGNCDIKFTYEEAKDYVVKNFTSFSEKLGKYAQKAFDNRWIDVYPREGKTGGAFCAGIHSIQESRIMLNFGGEFGDVSTAAHELGHGYHNECLKNDTVLNSSYSMPIAETASTFCETLVINSALKTATDEEAITILDNDLVGITQTIVDIYSRYRFETYIFEARKNGSLSVEDFNSLMEKAQKEAYGNGLDESALHRYMWLCKTHYYGAHDNFYNFPYAYGCLFSKGLYAKYTKEPDTFVEAYDQLLSETGKNNLYDVAKLADIDVRDQNFWESALEIVEEEIELFMSK